MESHDKEKCGNCFACKFEKAVEDFKNKKKYRVLDTGQHTGVHDIEDTINTLDEQGYEIIAVNSGYVFFRAIPPQLPQNLTPMVITKSDLEKMAKGKGEGSDGFSDDDIGEPFK